VVVEPDRGRACPIQRHAAVERGVRRVAAPCQRDIEAAVEDLFGRAIDGDIGIEEDDAARGCTRCKKVPLQAHAIGHQPGAVDFPADNAVDPQLGGRIGALVGQEHDARARCPLPCDGSGLNEHHPVVRFFEGRGGRARQVDVEEDDIEPVRPRGRIRCRLGRRQLGARQGTRELHDRKPLQAVGDRRLIAGKPECRGVGDASRAAVAHRRLDVAPAGENPRIVRCDLAQSVVIGKRLGKRAPALVQRRALETAGMEIRIEAQRLVEERHRLVEIRELCDRLCCGLPQRRYLRVFLDGLLQQIDRLVMQGVRAQKVSQGDRRFGALRRECSGLRQQRRGLLRPAGTLHQFAGTQEGIDVRRVRPQASL
jgi:hypothetical protein